MTFYGKSSHEVRMKMRTAHARLDRGAPVKDKRLRLRELISDWIATTLESSDRKASTKATYAHLLRSTVTDDPIGTRPLDRLRQRDIERWLIRLRDGGVDRPGLSASTVRQSFTVLSQVLDTAVRDGLIGVNPARTVRRPSVTRAEARFLSPEEVSALLAAASACTRYEPLLRFIVLTGLRKGEALALTWDNVDTGGALLRVRGTLSRDADGLHVTAPKSGSSRRDVPLTPAVVQLLQKIRTRQTAARLKAGPHWLDTPYVFTTDFGGPIDPRNALRAMKTSAVAAGLDRVSIHTLRHTAASLMLEAGVPLKTVSEVLGHASISVTGDIYGHVSTEGARTAMERLAVSLQWG